MVLRVVGEIDTLTYQMLFAAVGTALSGTVDRPTTHLVIDLAGVTVCGVRGMVLLAETATEAARADVNFALSACPALFERHWRQLFSDDTPVRRYPSAAAAVIAIDASSSRANWRGSLPD